MTISSQNRKSGPFLGTGSVATYPFDFTVFEAADVVVTRTDLEDVETVLTLGSDYTVTLNADQNATPGGSVVLPANLTIGFKLTLTSEIAATQEVDLTNQGGFYPQVISRALDKLTIISQQLEEKVGRSWKIPISSDTATADELMAELFDAAANAVAAADRVDLGALDDAVAATSASEDAAELSRNAAQGHALAAAASAATAVANAANYASTAAALADVALTVGSQFTVASGDLVQMYRKEAGPVATFLYSVANGDFALSARRTLGLPSSAPYLALNSGSITPTCFRAFVPSSSGVAHEIYLVVRTNGCDWINILSSGAGAGLPADVTIRLSTREVTKGTPTSGGAYPVALRYLGGDRWEIKVSSTSTGTGSGNVQLRPSLNGELTFTGDTTKGLWVEAFEVRLAGSSVNLWPSNDVSTANFTKTGLTSSISATPEEAISQDVKAAEDTADSLDVLVNGRMSGVRLTEAAGAGLNVRIYHPLALVSGDVVTLRARVKRDSRTRFNLFSGTVVNVDGTFDLTAGTATGTGATIEPLGADWYLCSITGTAGSTGTANLQFRVFPATGGHPYTGDGTSGLFLESAEILVNGIPVVQSRTTDFSRANWVKNSISFTQGAARYIGIKQALLDGATPPYEDGQTVLVGLKTAVIGDSISAQLQYTAPLAEQTGIVLTNLSAGGACLASGSSGGSLAIYNQIASIPTDSELVIVQAGVNDFGTDNSALGALGDTTTATFYGAIHASVLAIRARAPDAAIVFLTPYSGAAAHATHRHFRTNTLGHTLQQFQQAVKVGAAFAGYPVINVGEDAGIGYHTPALFSDNLHINATGGLKYATFVAQKLRDLALEGVVA